MKVGLLYTLSCSLHPSSLDAFIFNAQMCHIPIRCFLNCLSSVSLRKRVFLGFVDWSNVFTLYAYY